MKAKHEFRNENDWYRYLHTLYMMKAMQGILAQNLLTTDSDEIDELILGDKNKPEEVYKRSKEYADYFIKKIKEK
jgi:hypothetical protein